AAKVEPHGVALIFRRPAFRASSFGYFGHMWELYAFWTFVPVVLAAHGEPRVSLWSFAVIAAGFIGCAAGGLVSLRSGSAPVAFAQLLASGICCVLSPLLFAAPGPAFLAFLLFWGIVVVGDSPQFSGRTTATSRSHRPRGRVAASPRSCGSRLASPAIASRRWQAPSIASPCSRSR